MWQHMQGSSGWGDAIVMVPWEMWRAYGDRDVLAELWPSMVSWIDFAADGGPPASSREPRRRPVPRRRRTSSSSGTARTTGANGSSRARSPMIT